MASKAIKGITIEIDGNTGPLQDALKDVDKQTRQTTSELREIDRALKFNPGNVELITQQQELLAQQVNTTTTRLNTLRQAQAQVQQQFDSGDLGEEAYRAFQRELIATESQLSNYQNRIEESRQNQERLANSTRDLSTFFEATGTEIEQFTDVIGGRLASAIRNGSASADQMNQALLRISRSVLGTSVDINELQQTLRQIETTNIEQVALDLNRIGNSAEDAEREVGSLKDGLGGIAGAVTGAVAGVSILETVFEDAANAAKIEMRLDVDEASLKSAESSVREVSAVLGDNQIAIEAVAKQWQLYGDNGTEANEKILRMASAISYAYEDIDLKELIQESSEIAKIFDLGQEEVLGLTNQLLKLGFPPDQLDIISEYGSQLELMGYTGEQAFNLIANAANSDTWNIDNLLDGIKEARLQMSGFAGGWKIDMAYIIDQAGLTGEVFQNWGKDIVEGGEAGSKALVELSKYILNMQEGTAKWDLATAVFGTKYEDQGNALIEAIVESESAILNTKDSVDGLNASLETVQADPMVALSTAFGQMKNALSPVLEVLAKIVTKIAEFIQNNPALAATIAAIISVVGLLTGAFAVLMPAIGALMTAIAPLGGVLGVLSTAFGALVSPIGLAVGAIALIGGAIGLVSVGLSQNSIEVDDWKENVSESTAEVLGGFMDLSEQATLSLNQLAWSGTAVTQEMANNLIGTYTSMSTQILDNMNQRHTQELEAMQSHFTTSEALTQEQENAILEKVRVSNAEQEKIIQDANARIKEILTLASTEKRAITSQEQEEINALQSTMKDNAIKYMTESEVEQKAILENLKNEAKDITTEQAAEVIKNSLKQKEETVKEAETQYNDVVKWAIRQRDETGTISAEEAEAIIKEAKDKKDGVVKNAEEMHQGVVG